MKKIRKVFDQYHIRIDARANQGLKIEEMKRRPKMPYAPAEKESGSEAVSEAV